MRKYATMEQKAIASALGVREYIDGTPEAEVRYRISFLQKALRDSGAKTLVLGVSGGVDSLVAGRLCQIACSEMGDEYQFIAVRLPYGVQQDADDVEVSLSFITPDRIVDVPIESSVDGMSDALIEDLLSNGVPRHDIDFHRGNIKARIRMVAQYALAGTYRGLVVGTDHASEALMGFFTKHGDGACDIAPLGGLTKQQVREVGKELRGPESIIHKPPTADLEDLCPGRPDEEALGVSYELMEKFLWGREVRHEEFKLIVGRYNATSHKRKPPLSPT